MKGNRGEVNEASVKQRAVLQKLDPDIAAAMPVNLAGTYLATRIGELEEDSFPCYFQLGGLHQQRMVRIGNNEIQNAVSLEFLIHARYFRPDTLKDLVETGKRFCPKGDSRAVLPVGKVDDDTFIFKVEIIQPVNQLLSGDVTSGGQPWFRTGPIPHMDTQYATFAMIAVSTPHAEEPP